MNVTRILLAALAAFIAYFILGGLLFAVGPLRAEFVIRNYVNPLTA